MTNTSVTLDETGVADAINGNGPYESARNRMFALDFQTQVQDMKAIAGQPDYALGSVHAVTRDGTLVIASASGSQLASYAWGAANVILLVGAQKLVPTLDAAHERIYQHSLSSRMPARRRHTDSTAVSERSWKSTRNNRDASTSSSSVSQSASERGPSSEPRGRSAAVEDVGDSDRFGDQLDGLAAGQTRPGDETSLCAGRRCRASCRPAAAWRDRGRERPGEDRARACARPAGTANVGDLCSQRAELFRGAGDVDAEAPAHGVPGPVGRGAGHRCGGPDRLDRQGERRRR